jgi:hydroxyethylthiazole kinase-like uncharacterized protein yjeF
MKLVTSRQMQAIERATSERYGIPSLILMENAGRAVAEATCRCFPRARSIAVLAGVGNNGGDGFVAARHLAGRCQVIVFMAGKEEKLKGDALVHYRALQAFPVELRHIEEDRLGEALAAMKGSDLLIDALFGTGLSGTLAPFFARLIEGAQALGVPILAVDIPSGLDADLGIPRGVAFHAHRTVTMGLPKVGMLAPSAVDYVGELEVAELGFPPALLVDEALPGHLIGPDLLQSILPARPHEAHKGTSGTVLVLAGSLFYRGAANLAGLAALRAGAGLVRLALPRSLCLVNLDKPDELVQLPLPEEGEPVLASIALEASLAAAQEAQAVVLGPGLGQHPATINFVLRFLAQNKTPTVLDADGLNAVASCPQILLETPAPLVLTPHPGEMARLLARSTASVQEDRIATALEAASRFDSVAVLKGFRTVVADPIGRFYLNPNGNPAMATAGMGDILAGTIGGLLAQGATPLVATLLGVYTHGLAGDRAAQEMGPRGILPSDLLPRLPRAMADALNPP